MAGTGAWVRLLERHRGRLVKDPDINRIIPLLAKRRFFSVVEERQIASATNPGRIDILIDKVLRDPNAVVGFCNALEECAPHLLTELLLDQGDELSDARQRVDALQAERDRLVSSLENLSAHLDKPHNPKRFDRAANKVSNSSLKHGLVDSEDGAVVEEMGDNIVWQLHHISLQRVVNYGFGIAVSGGCDTPHFASGDPSIAISDVLKGGPAEGKLQLNDRIVSANGISLENVNHATAIQVLKNCSESVHLVIRRRVVVPATMEREAPLRITLTKRNKKDEFGLALGCRFFIQEMLPNSLASQYAGLKVGDTLLKINNTPLEGLSLPEVKKLLDKSRDKLQIIVTKPRPEECLQPPPIPPRVDEGYATFRSQPDQDVNFYRPSVRSEDDFYPDGLHHPGQEAVSGNYYNPPQNGDYLDHETGFRGHPEEEDVFARPPLDETEIRHVAFQKDKQKGLGLRLAGGNATGIFIASVQPGSGAEAQGLAEGDQILQANGLDVVGLTREEAVAYLTSLEGQVTLIVQYKKEDYESIMASHEAGDSFYIRTHFQYPDAEANGEHSFKVGDIFHIKDTLFRGVGGSWLAIRVGPNGEELKKGTIPNRKKAEAIAAAQQAENIEKDGLHTRNRGGLFKRKSTRRAKSLGKDHWEDVIFSGEDEEEAGLTTKFPPYERVVLRDPACVRPVVLFGAIADVARDRLLTEFPDRFESPQIDRGTDSDPKKAKAGIIRFGAIREAMNKQKHCVLDVTPYHVDRLNYAQYYPIVIFLHGESKQAIKEVRSQWRGNSATNKNPKKLQEMNEKMEHLYGHLFTGTINHTATDAWFPKLMEIIESQQRRPMWMSEKKPEEDMNDDFMFPMPNRMSLAGGPDVDQDIALGSDTFDASPMQKKRLVRSSSDPSINTTERVPGIPPYPAPPGYHNAKAIPYRSRDDSGWDDYYLPRHVQGRSGDWQMHPDDRYYPHHHHDASWSPPQLSPQQSQPPFSHSGRSNIDIYATVAPKRRHRTPEGHQMGAHDQYDRIAADDKYEPRHDRIASDDRGLHHNRTSSDEQYGRERVSSDDLYRMQAGRPMAHADVHTAPAPGEQKGYNDASSHDSDSYSRYVSSPSNKHDDSKLRDKFGSLQMGGHDRNPATHDPYRFTRSTANPVSGAQIDRAKLNDLTARYRRGDKQQVRVNKVGGPSSPPAQLSEKNQGLAFQTKKEPPPVPAKTYALKDRGVDIEEVKARNYENSNRAYNYSEVTFHRQHSAGELRYQQDHLPSQLLHGSSESPYEYISARGQLVPSRRDAHLQPTGRGDIPPSLPPSLSPEDFARDGVGGYKEPLSSRAFSNSVYMNHRDIDRARGADDVEREAPRLDQSGYTRPRTDDEQLRELQRSRQRIPSDSRMASHTKSETHVNARSNTRWNKYKSWDNEKEAQKTFDTYKRLITPGFYGSRKQISKSHDELREAASGQRGPQPTQRQGQSSAFEAYKRTSDGSQSQLTDDEEAGKQSLDILDLNSHEISSAASSVVPCVMSKQAQRSFHKLPSLPPLSLNYPRPLTLPSDSLAPSVGTFRKRPRPSSLPPIRGQTYESAMQPSHLPSQLCSPQLLTSLPRASSSGFSKRATVRPSLPLPLPLQQPFTKMAQASRASSLPSCFLPPTPPPLPLLPPPPPPPLIVTPLPPVEKTEEGEFLATGILTRGGLGSKDRILSENPIERAEQMVDSEASKSISSPEMVIACSSQEGDSQTVVATARGVFTSSGGVLESKETGVSIVIPPGALPEGSQQEIYFKVCSGNSLLPPLDKDKGETLLSPLVMCGPHGLQFHKPVELRLPHSASVNPENWSFALKSSDSPSGQPTQWQNMTLAGSEGVTQGRVNQTSVSVLVDHF